MKSSDCILRAMVEDDVPNYARTLKRSFNEWHRKHGLNRDFFPFEEKDLAIFWQVYSRISPGHSVAVIDSSSGDMMGACFYHPREHHVSLGIMCVNPDYFGRGVGKQIVNRIIEFTESNGYDSLRLVGSAMNIDSFSLYNRAGFVPRETYQDMILAVPAQGLGQAAVRDARVRDATLQDVAAIKSLELEISGLCRENDYRFMIENPLGIQHASVIENGGSGISGFMCSIRHAVIKMIGPAFARTEADMLALLLRELDRFRGDTVLAVVPMTSRLLVETLYRLGAKNVETHLCQVRGKFQPFAGIVLPSFLPETS